MIKICPYCHEEFEKEKGSKRIYCSKKCCSYASFERGLTPEKLERKRENHKDFIKNNPNYMALWRLKNREKINKQHLDRVIIEREECFKLIGSECIICHKKDKKKLLFHERSGIRHQKNMYYILKNHERFVTICKLHHNILHRLEENREFLSALFELMNYIKL